MNKKVVTIIMLLLTLGIIGVTVFVSQTAQQDQGIDDASASGCNLCFSSRTCTTDFEWTQGYYSGCTTRDSGGPVVRNNKPDVNNKGTVQAGDQGRAKSKTTGKTLTAGQNVNNESAPKETVVGVANGKYTVYFANGGTATFDVRDPGGATAAKAAAEIASTYTTKSAYQQATQPVAAKAATDTNPRVKGYYFKALDRAICGPGYIKSQTGCKAGTIYTGTTTTGTACCLSTSFYDQASCTSYDALQMCQLNRCKAQLDCSAYSPRQALSGIQTVDSCVNAPTGARTTCDGPNQSFCNKDGSIGASVPTDYCMALNNVDAQGNTWNVNRGALTEGTSCTGWKKMSNGEGGNFMGCTSTGQACVCDATGKLDCFADTPNGNQQADSCPQPTGSISTAQSVPDSPLPGFVALTAENIITTTGGTSGTSSGGTTTTTGGGTTPTTVNTQCVYLQQSSPAAAANYPPGQVFSYTAEFTCNGLNSNLALSVLDGSNNPVGSPTVATQTNQSYDALSNTCVYQFEWTATGVTDGTYNVRLLNNGSAGSEINSPVACTKQLAVLSTAVEQPAFSVYKSAGYSCSDQGATINYTITASNIGNIAAPLDFVRDTLPSQIDGSNTSQVTNITPAPTSRTSTTLRWDVNQSLAPGENRNFTYTVVLTPAQVISIGNNTLANTVLIQYGDNDSTSQFEHNLTMNCLPDTGLFDENPVLFIGILIIVIGILLNRSGGVLNLLGYEVDSQSDASSGLGSKIIGMLPKITFGEITYEDRVAESLRKDRDKKS